jgi:hypothetical protein
MLTYIQRKEFLVDLEIIILCIYLQYYQVGKLIS